MPFLPSLADHATMADFSEIFDQVPKVANKQILFRGPSSLTMGERELIMAFVSGLNSCDLCYDVHSKCSCAMGIEQAVLDKISSEQKLEFDDTRIAPILLYVQKLTRRPGKMNQKDVDRVLAAGFDESALVDAIGICAFANMMNRMVCAAGIQGTQQYREKVTDIRVAKAKKIKMKEGGSRKNASEASNL